MKYSAVSQIKRAVDQILIDYPEGEEFFDVLDEFIRKKAGNQLFKYSLKQIGEVIIVLSGGFGYVVADKIDKGILPKVSYILFEGGIRKNGNVKVSRFSIHKEMNRAVFFDDTIYGGRTFRLIQKWISENTDIEIEKAFIIYDGRPDKLDDVDSVFRYYDFFNAKPNFIFKEENNDYLMVSSTTSVTTVN